MHKMKMMKEDDGNVSPETPRNFHSRSSLMSCRLGDDGGIDMGEGLILASNE